MHGMKSRRGAARLGAGAAAVALAAASAVAVSTPAAADSGEAPGAGASSAYGVNADLAVAGTEVVDLGPLPKVQSKGAPKEDQERQVKEKNLLEITAQPILYLELLETTAKGPHATATAKQLSLLEGAIEAKLLEAKCTGDEGSTTVAHLVVGGQTIIGEEAQPGPNTTVKLPPEVEQAQELQQLGELANVQLTLNKQEETDKGGIEVTALELKVNVGGDTLTKDLSISSVKCGPEKDGAQPSPSETDQLDEAPKPKPVEEDLAVTG